MKRANGLQQRHFFFREISEWVLGGEKERNIEDINWDLFGCWGNFIHTLEIRILVEYNPSLGLDNPHMLIPFLSSSIYIRKDIYKFILL